MGALIPRSYVDRHNTASSLAIKAIPGPKYSRVILGAIDELVKLDNSKKVTEFGESGDARDLSMGANPGEHSSPMIRRLPAGPRRDALIRWRALFEPFDKTQGRLRELVRPPQSCVPPFQ